MRVLMVLLVSVVLAAAPTRAQDHAAVVEQIVNGAHLGKLGKILKTGDTVSAGDTITTAANGVLKLRMTTGDLIVIGPSTRVRIDQLLRSKDIGVVEATLSLLSGFLRFAGDGKVKATKLKSRHATISIRGTVLDLHSDPSETTLYVEEGEVAARTDTESHTVATGQNLVAGADTRSGTGVPAKINAARTAVTSILGALPGPSRAAVLKLETTQGTIVIDLSHGLGGAFTGWLRAALRAQGYDGVAFERVATGKLAQTGPVAHRDQIGPPVEPKPTDGPFERGSVGLVLAKQQDQPAGHLFIALGPMRHLDGRFPRIGRVRLGWEAIERLAVGAPPSQPDKVLSATLARN